MTDIVAISRVTVGERARKEMGDLSTLADSITELGLLQPIVVTPDYRLIAGERRLAACRKLGWEEVPVRIAAALTTVKSLLRAEHDENTCRKDFTPTEAVALGKRMELALKPMAEAAKAATQAKPGERVGASKLDGPTETVGRVDEAAAAAAGMGRSTYRKAAEVVDAQADPDPLVAAVAREAAAEMDATGKVDPAHKKVAAAKADSPRAHKPKPAVRQQPQTKTGDLVARTVTQVKGLTTVLAGVTLGDWTPDAEEAAAYISDLDRAISALRNLRNQLKEKQ